MIKGICGDNLIWTLDDNGKLTISGTGSMNDCELFSTSPWFLYREQIKVIIIKQGITNIGDKAFYGCISLTNITIPNSITSIGSYAFNYCTSLTNIIIPNGVKSIGYAAFENCRLLTNLVISNSVTCIEEWAFYGCVSLTSITLPNSVTNIRRSVFFNCTSLTNITIPNSITNIGDEAFYDCTSLQSLGKYKACKIIDNKYFCRDYEFELNKWSDKIESIKLCESGYHYCTNLFEIFNYYFGELDKDIAIFEVKTKGEDSSEEDSSKHCCQQIKLTKRLYKDDIIKLLNK